MFRADPVQCDQRLLLYPLDRPTVGKNPACVDICWTSGRSDCRRRTTPVAIYLATGSRSTRRAVYLCAVYVTRKLTYAGSDLIERRCRLMGDWAAALGNT